MTKNKIDYSLLIKSLPRINDLIYGKVIEIGRNEIYLDLEGIFTGVIRGPELLDKSGEFSNLKKGDKTSAIVIETENETGLIELSFRQASHKIAWNKINEITTNKKPIIVKVLDANKGGLIVSYKKTQGFLPVSQLSQKNYPRVEDGDKNKILEKIKKFIGKNIEVGIITADEKNEKLIVSEKSIVNEKGSDDYKKYKIGDKVKGKISGLVDFGIFITFNNNKEGLVHISEIAWQRLDHPKDAVSVGDEVRAEIIDITKDGKVSLSIKNLLKDPWKNIAKKYSIGQIIDGRVLKINPFGLFVEVDPEIHGLAHISELSKNPIKDIREFANEGDVLKFKIVSIEPEDHRLGLSLASKHDNKSLKKNEEKK
ncbi:S1 RNA-binding domain-containing protein [Patescibacteria group bacterium]|nr:S1 RNA-binding domain-containing protein [Patescibacteria group bacterium]